ncbi:N-acetylmuramoyl-L-alanine amidase [Candidatus Pacearchaeota archaeon]|nr:N-acetylmuramoyl-L-alanine amidase [Candidatus Pacearchaeota archaeon]
MREIKKLIIHCTDSDDSLDIGFREINSWHHKNGWKSKSGISCGYHFIIRKDGSIEQGRPQKEVGAHSYGQNRSSLGIVWVGRKDFNMRQNKSMRALIRGLMFKYNLSVTDVYGHYEFTDKKTCPNINMDIYRAELLFQETI